MISLSRRLLGALPAAAYRPLNRLPLVPIYRQYSSGGYSAGGEPPSLPVNTIVKFVPQQEAWIVERFGRFHRILPPGLAILMPFIDKIRYVKSLKEVAIEIPSQSAITEDNVTLDIDGVLYVKIMDPYKASYGVEDPEYAITQLAQTTMRAEIGRLTLDRTLAERAALNQNIVQAINAASFDWGVKCLRYEIRDIHPPAKVIEAMHSQVSAERQKRADILASEGQRQAAINVAEGQKQSAILAASGQAETILLKAQASAEGIRRIAEAIQAKSGHDAVSLSIAESYIEAFGRVAKEGTTVLLPANVGEPAQMVTQAMTIYETIKRQKGNSATGVEEGIKFPTTKI